MRASIKFFIIFLYVLIPVIARGGVDGDTLSLKQAVETALKQSPLIKSAKYDVQISSEALRGAKGALFPRVDLGASYFNENQDIPYIPAQGTTIPAKFSDEIYSWGAYLKMPLYEGGRLAGQVRVAELERQAQTSLRAFTVQDLIANVTNAFNKLLQLKELKKAYMRSVEALERERRDAEALLKVGRVPKVELLRVDVQLAAERQNLIRAEEGMDRAKNALAFLMGVDAAGIKDVNGELAENKAARPEGMDLEGLIKGRPDVAAARKRVEAEKARLEVAKGKRYPSIDMVGDYGDHTGAGLKGREEVWETGVVASINIFDGGVISSEIGRQRTVYQKAVEALQLSTLKARQEVGDAVSLMREAEGRLDLAQKAVSQAREALRIEGLKYKTGAGTLTDVLLSESAMSLAEAGYYQALYDYSAAVTEFKRATGSIGTETGAER